MNLTRGLKRVFLLLLVVGLLALVLAACGDGDTGETEEGADEATEDEATEDDAAEGDAAGDEELTPITFVTDFGFAGRHAYYFVAQEKGYYEEAGLDVTFERGSGSSDAIRQVAAGQADLGFADTGTLILSRANDGVDVQVGAIVYQDSPWAIMVLEESGIEEPADLEGRVLADVPGSSMIALFPLYAEAAGFDPDAVTWSTADGGALAGMLGAGEADGIGMPVFGRALTEAAVDGEPIRVLPYAEAGLEHYANGIVFSEDLYAEDPDLVQAFIDATVRGMEDAFADPEEAGEIMHEAVPEVEPDIVAAETEGVGDLADHPLTEGHGLGYIDADRMQATLDLISEAFELEEDVSLEEIYVEGLAGS